MMLAVHPILSGLAPEIVLVAGASLILLMGLGRAVGKRDTMCSVALATLVAAIYAAYRLAGSAGDSSPLLLDDSLVWFTRLATLSMGLLIVLMSRHVPEDGEQGEFFGLTLCSLAGVLLVSVANDLIMLFLALEMVSVPTYILVGLSRRNIRAQEATGKYFFLGAFAAAITLYGFSFLYGAAGTTQLFGPVASGQSVATAVGAALADPLSDDRQLVVIGLLLSLGGLAFKVAAVPLHFYVADVYQGAASPVAGMLGFVPKFAGFVALIRLLSMCDWHYGDALFWLLWAMAAVTMCVGNTLALMQNNVKRMLAYSGIAHTGYMLVGLLAGPSLVGDASPMRDGISAILFYVVVYGVMNLGAFAALSYFRKSGEDEDDSVETLDDLAGTARRHPWAALALAICVLSLMGMPPTGGFLGKLYVFSSALASGEETGRFGPMLALVIIGVLNSAIAAAYYMRIVATCFLRPPADGIRSSSCPALRISLAVCAIALLLAFFRPTSLLTQANDAVDSIRAERLDVTPPIAPAATVRRP